MNLASTIFLLAGGMGSGCRGPNCGRKVLYHGTTLEKANEILKHGFKVKKSGSAHQGLTYGQKPSAVYFAESEHIAHSYGASAQYLKENPDGSPSTSDLKGRQYVVLRLEVPEKLHAQMKMDDVQSDSVYYQKDVSANWITKAEVFEHDGKKNSVPSALKALK